jgi:hypothetical protein
MFCVRILWAFYPILIVSFLVLAIVFSSLAGPLQSLATGYLTNYVNTSCNISSFVIQNQTAVTMSQGMFTEYRIVWNVTFHFKNESALLNSLAIWTPINDGWVSNIQTIQQQLDIIAANSTVPCYYRSQSPFDPSVDGFLFLHWDFTSVVLQYHTYVGVGIVFWGLMLVAVLLPILLWYRYHKSPKHWPEVSISNAYEMNPTNNNVKLTEELNSGTPGTPASPPEDPSSSEKTKPEKVDKTEEALKQEEYMRVRDLLQFSPTENVVTMTSPETEPTPNIEELPEQPHPPEPEVSNPLFIPTTSTTETEMETMTETNPTVAVPAPPQREEW